MKRQQMCVISSKCVLHYRATSASHPLLQLVFCDCRVWPALVPLLLFPFTAAAEESSLLEGWHDIWLFRFLINMLGYSTIIIPGYLLICYFKRINYLETGLGLCYTLQLEDTTLSAFVPRSFTNLPVCVPFISGSGTCYPVIKTCVFGSEVKTGLLDDVPAAPRSEGDSSSSVRQVIKLIFCAAGLQVGILPEHTVDEHTK